MARVCLRELSTPAECFRSKIVFQPTSITRSLPDRYIGCISDKLNLKLETNCPFKDLRDWELFRRSCHFALICAV